MAYTIKKYPRAFIQIPWDRYTTIIDHPDGTRSSKPWVLVQGVDFAGNLESGRTCAYSAARSRNLRAKSSVYRDADGNLILDAEGRPGVVVQFFPKEATS